MSTFQWNAANMSEEAPAEERSFKIAPEMVFKAISKIIIETIKAAGDGIIVC